MSFRDKVWLTCQKQRFLLLIRAKLCYNLIKRRMVTIPIWEVLIRSFNPQIDSNFFLSFCSFLKKVMFLLEHKTGRVFARMQLGKPF